MFAGVLHLKTSDSIQIIANASCKLLVRSHCNRFTLHVNQNLVALNQLLQWLGNVTCQPVSVLIDPKSQILKVYAIFVVEALTAALANVKSFPSSPRLYPKKQSLLVADSQTSLHLGSCVYLLPHDQQKGRQELVRTGSL